MKKSNLAMSNIKPKSLAGEQYGWQVSFCRNSQTIVMDFLFAEHDNSGELALQAAQHYRNEFKAKFPKVFSEPLERAVHGLRLCRGYSVNWQSTQIVECNIVLHKAKAFSVARYGYEGAYEKARKHRLSIVPGYIPETPPEQPEWLKTYFKNRTKKLKAIVVSYENFQQEAANKTVANKINCVELAKDCSDTDITSSTLQAPMCDTHIAKALNVGSTIGMVNITQEQPTHGASVLVKTLQGKIVPCIFSHTRDNTFEFVTLLEYNGSIKKISTLHNITEWAYEL